LRVGRAAECLGPRLNQRYSPALPLAELILAVASVSERKGAIMSTTFVFDMNKVFEDFVKVAFRNAMRAIGNPALDAAGIERRGPYHLRHTFATEALASGMSIFQLARVMGASVKTIDKHYWHLAHDSEDEIRSLLNARRT
jgi:integrase